MEEVRSVNEIEQLMLVYERLTIAIEEAAAAVSGWLEIALPGNDSTLDEVLRIQAFSIGKWAVVANARHHTAALHAWLDPSERELLKPQRDALEASCAKLEELLDKNGL